MRRVIAPLVALLTVCLSAFAESPSRPDFNWGPWRSLPVLDGGRYKPLDTLARETLRTLSGRSTFTDPETGRTLNPTELYLDMLFEWQGWNLPPDPHRAAGMGTHAAYFATHKPDKWDRARLLRVDHAALREALGMAEGEKCIAPLELAEAEIREPHTNEQTPFLTWAARLFRSRQEPATTLQKKGLELADKLFSYEAHRTGRRLYVLPVRDSEHQDWLPVGSLLQSSFDDQTDPTGGMRKAKEQLQNARAAYLAGSPESFNQASTTFLAMVRETGPRLGRYPRQGIIALELMYNRWAPFRLAWVFTSIAFVCLLAGSGTRWKAFSITGLTALGVSVLAMLIGFAARMVISGRAPVTNFYESVIFMALGAVVFGLVFGLIARKQYVLTAAAAVSAVALVLADSCPTVMDPGIRPLQPVLRSNFWLAVHVITVMLSYAAFALALAIGNITLGHYLVGSKRQEAINAQARFTYKSLQAGVLLLVAGTILGAMWADYSWGRFWGWDPKEVWALITLLSYLAVLHARCAGWIAARGLAAWSVVCFTMVIMAWYGVNLLRTGLHNYAFGGDGAEYYVFGAVVVQLLYVAAAALRRSERASERRMAASAA